MLGLSHNATASQIRSSYLDIQKAYRVLSNPKKRGLYDAQIQNTTELGFNEGVAPEPVNTTKISAEPVQAMALPADLGKASSLTLSFQSFRPLIDGDKNRLWSNIGSINQPKAERSMPLKLMAEIELTQEDTRYGGHIRLLEQVRAPCPTCSEREGFGSYELMQAGGQGVISGEYPRKISFPPGITNDYIVRIPLDRFGIGELYLQAYFHISEH